MPRSNRAERTSRRGRQRVLIIIENVPLARDHRAKKQVASLIEGGYEVAVITQAHFDNVAYRSIPRLRIYEYPAPPESSGKLSFVYEYAYSWLAAAALTLKAFVEGGFAAIQSGEPPDIYFLLAVPFKLAGRRFVVDQRDLSPELYLARYRGGGGRLLPLLQTLERLSWRSADHVLCVNGSLRDVIVKRGRVPAGSVTVIRNGPVLGRTTSRPPRGKLKEGKSFLACWLGLMGPQDRVDLALWAVHHVVHTFGRSDCHFAFIGDGEVLPQLQSLAGDLDISDWVTFTGWLDEDDAFDYLSTADLALDSSLQEEVSPVKGMEYMAFGLPVVAFDLKEMRAMAEGAAVYVEPGDAPGFARAIIDLLDDPVRRSVMGRAGRQRVEDTLAWDRQKEAYLRVYERLLGPPERRDEQAPHVAG